MNAMQAKKAYEVQQEVSEAVDKAVTAEEDAMDALINAERDMDNARTERLLAERMQDKACAVTKVAENPESFFHQVFGDIRWSFVAVWINPLFGFGPDDEVVHVPSGAIVRTDWLYGWEALAKSTRCAVLDRADAAADRGAYLAFHLRNSDRSDGESVATPSMQRTACCIAAALRDAFDAVTAETRAARAIRTNA